MVRFEKIPNVMFKGFLPYVALATIKKEGKATAYTIIQRIQEELSIFASAGSVYTAIYGLERQGYIEGRTKYKITQKGLALLQNVKLTMKEFFPKIEALLEGA
jgi:DNA-binding PadR family transcriptional regulator